ncbi:MAG: helix-turn-helix domain-containing protein [Bacteroidia bacterium]|nr:helix-turn-helix domain-containing protein [Bacteroidia bacterium]
MERLHFERTKYGKELLMDACNESELDIVADTMVLNFYTLIFLEKGNGTYCLDTESIPFCDHMVLFVKPGQINKVDKAVFEKCHLLFFEGEFLDEFFNDKDFIFKFSFFYRSDKPSYLIFQHDDEFDFFNNIAVEIWAEIKNLTQDSHHILRAQIYYLLVKLHRAYSQQYGQARDTMADPVVLRFSRLLDGEVRNNLSVEQFASRLSISRVHLNNLCQRYFSKTAHQLIRERIIAEIKKEIRYTGKDFSEIAYEFNFSAPSHFARFFKQMTGVSPLSFREQLSNW